MQQDIFESQGNKLHRINSLIADLGGADIGLRSSSPHGLLIEHLRAARTALLGAMPVEYLLSLEQAAESVGCIVEKSAREQTKEKLLDLMEQKSNGKTKNTGFKIPQFTLEQEEGFLEFWGHYVHLITVGLVAVAFISSYFSDPGSRNSIQEILHAVHLVALTLVAVQLILFMLFSHNVGRELATALDAPFPSDASPTPEVGVKPPRPYRVEPVTPTDVEFVSGRGSEFDVLVRLNRAGFKGSAFEMTLKELEERNLGLASKNPKAFMLVRNPKRAVLDDDDFIGFSCVLPLNEVGADCYLNGIVKDRDMRASLICKPGDESKDLLIFAIALDKKYRKVKGLRAEYYTHLLAVTPYHVMTVAQAQQGALAKPKAWAQSEHRKLNKNLERRGFKRENGKKTADRFLLYSFQLDL